MENPSSLIASACRVDAGGRSEKDDVTTRDKLSEHAARMKNTGMKKKQEVKQWTAMILLLENL